MIICSSDHPEEKKTYISYHCNFGRNEKELSSYVINYDKFRKSIYILSACGLQGKSHIFKINKNE